MIKGPHDLVPNDLVRFVTTFPSETYTLILFEVTAYIIHFYDSLPLLCSSFSFHSPQSNTYTYIYIYIFLLPWKNYSAEPLGPTMHRDHSAMGPQGCFMLLYVSLVASLPHSPDDHFKHHPSSVLDATPPLPFMADD